MPIVVNFADEDTSSDDEPIFQNLTNTINNDKRPRSGSKTPSPNPSKKVRPSLSPIDRNWVIYFCSGPFNIRIRKNKKSKRVSSPKTETKFQN